MMRFFYVIVKSAATKQSQNICVMIIIQNEFKKRLVYNKVAEILTCICFRQKKIKYFSKT